jgi:pilus assembly protein CpaE
MRARLTTHGGGIAGAVEHYADKATPQILIVESSDDEKHIFSALEALAGVCQGETNVILIGVHNDVHLYRALRRQGVHEYLPSPPDPRLLSESLAELCSDDDKVKTGRLISFIGAAGGVGSSQLAHNTAFQLARLYDAETSVLDLDLAFGTVALDFNTESPQHIGAVLAEPDRIDQSLVQRVAAKYNDNVYLLTAPPQIGAMNDVQPAALEALLKVVRRNTAFVVVDLPSTWTGWIQHLLTLSDEIVVTATPRLHALRNAKQLADMLNPRRANDSPVRIILNKVGASPKTELTTKDFITALGAPPALAFPHDPGVFDTAANNGKMVGEVAKAPKVVDLLEQLATLTSGRQAGKAAKKGLTTIFRLPPRRKKRAG